MTGMCAVPPAMSILPFRPLKTSRGEAAKAVAAKRHITAAMRNFFIEKHSLCNFYVVYCKKPNNRPTTGRRREGAAVPQRNINAGGIPYISGPGTESILFKGENWTKGVSGGRAMHPVHFISARSRHLFPPSLKSLHYIYSCNITLNQINVNAGFCLKVEI